MAAKVVAQTEVIEKSLTEQAEEALERLDKGLGTDADYALVTKVSLAALSLQKSSGEKDPENADDDGHEEPDADDAPGATEADDDDDADNEDDAEEEDAAEKSVRITDPILAEEEGEPLWKAMAAATEEAGAENGEEYLSADPILKSIGEGMDVILKAVQEQQAALETVGKRLAKIEKSLLTPAVGTSTAVAVETPKSEEIDPLKKSADASLATQFREILAPLENRLNEVTELVGRFPFSPHRNGVQNGAGLQKALNGGGASTGLSPAQLEEVVLEGIHKSYSANQIEQGEATRACQAIGDNRHMDPLEVVKKIAPDAMPTIKQLIEARS